jgi:hypothetical protein
MIAEDPPKDPKRRNQDFPWDDFDSVGYLAHNYEGVLDEDRQVITFVRDFLVDVSMRFGERSTLRGIDVGTGPNLYPTLAMLPFCHEVTLYEFSKSNVDWPQGQHAAHWPSWTTSWRDFWKLLCEKAPYANVDRPDMNVELSRRTKVTWGNVLDPDKTMIGSYDIGTMFFGPESISTEQAEFESALNHMLDFLRPDSPFAVALMEHSQGYPVGNTRFPGISIDHNQVIEFLTRRASYLISKHIDRGDPPIRDGYDGMIIVCGLIQGLT